MGHKKKKHKGRRRNKKQYQVRRDITFEEALSHVKEQPYFALKQWRNTRYYISSDGFVYRRKNNHKYIAIPIYEYHNYYNVDLYLLRRGKEVKKRYPIHRLVGECYCYSFDKFVTLHHISHDRYDNSVNNLYACSRVMHDIIEWEERPVYSNLKYNTTEDEEF